MAEDALAMRRTTAQRASVPGIVENMPMIDRRSFLGGAGAALALAPVAAWARRSAVEGAGLSAPLEIVDDVYGVPHIRAATIPDAFFGQGYVVARDRLF
ncbi:MAG: penicillin acylase family protein, partial [Rhizorhabdus sp.]